MIETHLLCEPFAKPIFGFFFNVELTKVKKHE